MRKKLSSEAEYHLSMFYWYAVSLYGTDYQTMLNKNFRDTSGFHFQISFEEHSIVSDLKLEISKAITDEEFIDAVVNHRKRLIQEKNVIKELSTLKPSEFQKFEQWHLLHQTKKPYRFQKRA